MSSVKCLSGYVNVGLRQEHSEDTRLRELEKKLRHYSKSISIDSLQQHDLPMAARWQRYITARVQTTAQEKITWSTDEKNDIHVYFTRRAHFFVQTVN